MTEEEFRQSGHDWAEEIYGLLEDLEYTAPERLHIWVAGLIAWRNRYRAAKEKANER